MKVRKATMMLAAGLMAITPVASNAASSLSVARAVPQLSGASFLQDDEGHHGRGTAVILGVVLVVLIVAAAIAGNGKSPNNPHSP